VLVHVIAAGLHLWSRRHYGRAAQIIIARSAVLDAASAAQQVWINKPIDPSQPPQLFPG